MPSPFLRLGQKNTSDESMTPDRPHPTDPILETYEGSNHPYRGIEIHGVEDNADPSNPQMEWADGTRKVIYDEDKPSIDPVPVRIVAEGGDERRRLRTWNYVLTAGQVARVAQMNTNRSKIRIKNTAAFAVFIGDTESVASYTGYPLAQNESLDFDTQEEIWVFNPDGALSATIALIDQFSVVVGR
jgi:hypothetical protein